MHPIIQELNREHEKEHVDDFEVGDTVDVHVRIVEGEKERVQVFTGTVIARRGGGVNESFTVRRLVQGEGVERVFPLHGPRIEKVVVRHHGRTRRAKLYFLRDRIGKATRLREQAPSRAGKGARAAAAPAPTAVESPAEESPVEPREATENE